jgi:hypothetical protein
VADIHLPSYGICCDGIGRDGGLVGGLLWWSAHRDQRVQVAEKAKETNKIAEEEQRPAPSISPSPACPSQSPVPSPEPSPTASATAVNDTGKSGIEGELLAAWKEDAQYSPGAMNRYLTLRV